MVQRYMWRGESHVSDLCSAGSNTPLTLICQAFNPIWRVAELPKTAYSKLIPVWQVHTGPLCTHSNEQQLANNNSLILLKLRGTCRGGESTYMNPMLITREHVELLTLPWSGKNSPKVWAFPPFVTSKCSFSIMTHWQSCTFKGVTMTYDDIDLCMMTLAFVWHHFVMKEWCHQLKSHTVWLA